MNWLKRLFNRAPPAKQYAPPPQTIPVGDDILVLPATGKVWLYCQYDMALREIRIIPLGKQELTP